MIRTILVADDERSTAVLVQRRLEKENYNVIIAANGREALKQIKAKPVDMVITDVVMPEMDGVDLYMALREDPDTAHIPVIIVTDKEVFKESFASLGVELYCPKPFNFEDLLAKIKKVEQKAVESRPYFKVIVMGPDHDLLEKVYTILSERNCIVAKVDNVIEIGLRSFMVNPRLILIDLHTREFATTKEIIRSLRSYEFFRHTKIVVYSNFSAGDRDVIAGLDRVDDEIQECLLAGANKYIGRFNRVTFIDQIKEFGV